MTKPLLILASSSPQRLNLLKLIGVVPDRTIPAHINETPLKKELPKDVKLDGYIQTVHGTDYTYEDESSYFTATVMFEGQVYVFQMIGKKENMGYLYDDFEDLQIGRAHV